MARRSRKLSAVADRCIRLEQSCALDSGVKVDRESGVISNVAIITAGPALGHGFEVDQTMLEQVEAAINKSGKPVPVRLTHDGEWITDPIMLLLGNVTGKARIEGKSVRADVRLAKYAEKNPSGNLREYLFSLVEEAPSQIGLSIVFEPDKFEENREDEHGHRLIPAGRLKSLRAVDFVGDPAANPNGLLSTPTATTPSGDTPMNKKLRKILEAMGLSATATEEEAIVFAEKHLNGAAMTNKLRKILADAKHVTLEASDDEALGFVKKMIGDAQGLGEGEDEGEDEGDGAAPPADPNMNARKKGTTLSTKDPEEIARLAIETERKRVQHIKGVAKRLGLGEAWAQQQEAGGFEISAVNENAIKTLEKRTAGGRTMPPDIKVGEDRNLSTLGAAMADAVMLRGGVNQIPQTDERGFVEFEEKWDSGNMCMSRKVTLRKPHERAREFRGMSLYEMAKCYLQQIGCDTTGLSKIDVCKAVFSYREMTRLSGGSFNHSSDDFPSILADVANKTLRQGYVETPAQWPAFCRRSTAPDFKQVNRTQLGEFGNLNAVNENGEVEFVTIGDGKEVFTLSTYAAIYAQTWQSLINDDLNAFLRIPMLQGAAAKRKEDQLGFGVLTGNAAMQDGQNLFSSAHNNIISGTPSGAPSVAQLNAMTAKLMKQTGLNSAAILDLMPAVIIGPAALRGTILELIESTFKPGGNQENNIWAGKLTPVVSARLDLVSATDWYLAASTSQIDTIEVCFLEDEPQPVLDQEDGFETLGRKYRVRHSLAAAAIDYRGMVMNDNT